MRRFTIVITGECADDVPVEDVEMVAWHALTQVEEPCISIDAWSDRTFTTSNVTYEVALEGQ
jgi:hypothetical protein